MGGEITNGKHKEHEHDSALDAFIQNELQEFL